MGGAASGVKKPRTGVSRSSQFEPPGLELYRRRPPSLKVKTAKIIKKTVLIDIGSGTTGKYHPSWIPPHTRFVQQLISRLPATGLFMLCRKPSTVNEPIINRHAVLIWLAPVFLWAIPMTAKGLSDDSAEVTSVLATHRDDRNPAITAVGLRATGDMVDTAATRICILVDTSASQTGHVFEQALAATKELLAETRPIDKVMLAAIDVQFIPLSDRFESASSSLTEASLSKLSSRTPLGNTDLLEGIKSAIDVLGGEPSPAALVYVGDGPSLDGILPADFAATLASLRNRRISFSAITIGTQVNWPCLAALAAGTGGNVLNPTANMSPKQVGAALAHQVTNPILWPDDNSLTLESVQAGAQLAMLPFQLPPLRQDRESFALILGPLNQLRMELSVEKTPQQDRPNTWTETTLSFTLPAREPVSDNTFLEQLARNAGSTGGIYLPLLGKDGLEIAKNRILNEAATLTGLAVQAKSTGDYEAASRLANAALTRDPDDPQAAIVQASVRTNTDNFVKPVTQTTDLPSQANASNGLQRRRPSDDDVASDRSLEELRDIENRQKIRSQLIEREVAVGLRNARHLMATDPNMARIELKNLQQQVRDSGDLDEALRSRLNRQIEISLREVIVRSREKLERDLAAERARAVARERARIAGELSRREEKFSQLAKRFQAIVDDIATNRPYTTPDTSLADEKPLRDTAREMKSTAPPAHMQGSIPITARISAAQATELAEMLAYNDHNVVHRRHMQRGFMDALDNTDDAAIPMSDEPPIRFPDASRWREISKLREKWKSTNLAGDSPREEKIYSVLKETVPPLDFGDGVSLREFELTMTDTLGIPVVLDERVLAGELGLDLNEPEAMRGAYSGISTRSALRRVLANVFETPLTYVVKDEVLLITDKQYAADNYISTKVYPVGDLVIPANPQLGTSGGPTNGSGAGFGAGGQQQQNAMGGGGMGGGVF